MVSSKGKRETASEAFEFRYKSRSLVAGLTVTFQKAVKKQETVSKHDI